MLNHTTTPPSAQQQLSAQIQRLKMKAFTAAMSYAGDDDSHSDSEPAAALPSPPLSRPRLKRRLRFGDDVCECGGESQGETDTDESEFTGPDGSFKLPRLMHPELKRQHAVVSIKHERHEPVNVPARTLLLLSKPSRMLPCTLSRAMNLRFVQ